MIAVKRALFVCVENANRSQMAEAVARTIGGAAVEAYSAGSSPLGVVNSKAVEVMRELGYDLSAHDSKSLDELPDVEFDFVAIRWAAATLAQWCGLSDGQTGLFPTPSICRSVSFVPSAIGSGTR